MRVALLCQGTRRVDGYAVRSRTRAPRRSRTRPPGTAQAGGVASRAGHSWLYSRLPLCTPYLPSIFGSLATMRCCILCSLCHGLILCFVVFADTFSYGDQTI